MEASVLLIESQIEMLFIQFDWTISIDIFDNKTAPLIIFFTSFSICQIQYFNCQNDLHSASYWPEYEIILLF